MGVLHAPGSTYMQASHTALKCERCQCVDGVKECRDHTPTCAAQCADGEHNDLDALDPCGCQACYPTAPSTKTRCIDSDLQPRSIGEWYRDTRSGQCMICHCQATSAVCRLMQPSCTGGCEEGFEPALDENNPCECVCRPISGCDFRGQQYANGDTWTVSAYHNCSCLNGTVMCELRAVKTCSPGALPCPTEAVIRSKNVYECDRCPADGETCPRQRVSFWFNRGVTCEFCFCISGRARCIPNPFGCSPCGPDHLEYPRVDSCSCPFCVPISNGA
ncbi:kielin/chordin-like protein [Sycon ciliatum]|uniref:kielin/chordin-like protein n=1 Tax=Sycon ciliatum TaxID=27933 RepID=UPI0031F70E82